MNKIIAFRLERDSAWALRAAAVFRGVPVSKLIRDAIDRELSTAAGPSAAADISPVRQENAQ